jgi:hypothetical protein
MDDGEITASEDDGCRKCGGMYSKRDLSLSGTTIEDESMTESVEIGPEKLW